MKLSRNQWIVLAVLVALAVLDVVTDGEVDLIDPFVDLVVEQQVFEDADVVEEAADVVESAGSSYDPATGIVTTEWRVIPGEGSGSGSGDGTGEPP